MKILHVIDSGGLYGAEIMLVSLAVAQTRMGMSPTIASIGKKGVGEKPLEAEAIRRGLKIKKFEMKAGPNIIGILKILKYAKENHFDIFHSHGYKTNILLGLIPYGLRGCPIISTLHGWTNSGAWTKMRFNEELDAFSLRFVDRVVLVNEGMLTQKKIQKIPKSKIAIINNGIEFQESPKDTEIKLDEVMKNELDKFCSTGKIIASIGRLSHEKGFKYLIEAVSILRNEKGLDVRLLIIGEGPEYKTLVQYADECGINDYFYMTGYVKNGKDLLKLTDYYVISSLTEGLPITLLEAMINKIPIVASAVGGIPFVVENGREAILVPPKHPRAIVDAVSTLQNDPSLVSNLVTLAEKKVLLKYGVDTMSKQYRELYVDVLNFYGRD